MDNLKLQDARYVGEVKSPGLSCGTAASTTVALPV